jgi:alpha-galactosidase
VPSPALADVVAARDDAFVRRDAGTDRWAIGNRNVLLSIAFDTSGTLAIQSLANAVTGDTSPISAAADFSVTAGSEDIELSRRKLTFSGANASETDSGVVLTFVFEHPALRLRFSRSYAAYPESPVIETWTRIESLANPDPITLSRLVGWQITMSAAPIKYVAGLRSYAQPGELGAFDIVEHDVEDDVPWEIGGDRRSTEDYLPFVSIDDGRNTFFGGIMWSGAWRLLAERHDGRLRVTASYPESPAVSPSRPIEIPHAFFGLVSHGPAAESTAVRQFILNGPRAGRPFTPLVTYNTWFAFGTLISEGVLRREIDRIASLGVELFVVDAGWYTDWDRASVVDFEAGLGRLLEDPDRFPSSLASLVEHTHAAGMRFGLWVEPERVALDLLGELGVDEAWLATQNGGYGFDKVAQVCLAGAPAREWLVDRLSKMIETIRPDYLKWDNNGWINCTREGHGHGTADGNFAHVDGLYEVLREIRRRFPDLIIENVSGGGNRLDFGMLSLTDVGWMDDHTSPSSHVRHNLEGLTSVLPPAYLLSFVMGGAGESIDLYSDLPNIVRSRMPGVLGLTFRMAELADDAIQMMTAEIEHYKGYRNFLQRASATLLSRQAPLFDSWDLLQEVTDDGLYAVMYAFKNPLSDDRLRVYPRGLRDEVVYEVWSEDLGLLGTAAGQSIMIDGIELNQYPGTSQAHVLVLVATPSVDLVAAPRRSSAGPRRR